MDKKRLSRRDFLLGSATVGAGAILAACAAPEAEVIEKIVKETVMVEGEVVEVEKVVEVEVETEVEVEKVVEVQVDRLRADMCMDYTPFDQDGVFNDFRWGGDISPSARADAEGWFADWYPNMTWEPTHAPWGEYWTKFPVIMAAGEHPDCARMHFTRTSPFGCKGWLHPIDDYIDVLPPWEWPDDYHFSAMDNLAYAGVQYGLANDWAPRAVLINLDIMEEAGMPYPVADDWTHDDIVDYAEAATKDTPEGKQWGMLMGHHPIRDWNVVKAFGGSFFNEDVTESRFDDPKTRETFQWMWDASFVRKVTVPSAEEQVFGGSFGAFTAGKVGMWWTLSDETRAAIEAIGDTFRLGVGPEPLGPAGRYGFEGNCGWVIPSRSQWPDIAYEMMRYFLCDDDRQRFMAVSGFGGFPARKSSGKWNVMQIEETVPEYGHAAWELGGESVEHFPLFPDFMEWQGVWAKWMDPIWLEGEADIDGALDGMGEETNELFATREACAAPGSF